MELIFYKGRGKWLDFGVRVWTGGPYSHSEFRFESELTFSSSYRDGGIRWRDMQLRPDRWDRLAVDIDADTEERLLRWCAARSGAYDLWGIFGFLINRSINDTDKWYCSEVMAYGLNRFSVGGEDAFPWHSSPSSLYQQALAIPEVFRPTTAEFRPQLSRSYLAAARAMEQQLLALPMRQRSQKLAVLSGNDAVVHSITRSLLRGSRSLI